MNGMMTEGGNVGSGRSVCNRVPEYFYVLKEMTEKWGYLQD